MDITINNDLGRKISFKKKLKNFPVIFYILRFRRYISRRFELFHLLNKLYFLLIFRRVNYYQPLYNFPVLRNKRPQRACIDRADTVFQQIKSWGEGGHILDVGCSFGFFSFYFAERGYILNGIDSNADNIAICKTLKKMNKKKCSFSVALFDKEFVEKLGNNQYDIAFLYSVMHHIICQNGIDYAQDLMFQLTRKIAVLFVELAVKSEEVGFPWREKLPEDELTIFSKCTDIEIKKLGYYSNPLSPVRRPLYMITRKTMQLCGEDHTIYKKRFTSSPRARYLGRHFYDCGDKFIKKYFLSEHKGGLVEIEREIHNHQILPVNTIFPSLLSCHRLENTIEIAYAKLPGESAHDRLIQGKKIRGC